jgi:hypothetical protein
MTRTTAVSSARRAFCVPFGTTADSGGQQKGNSNPRIWFWHSADYGHERMDNGGTALSPSV